VMNAYHDVVPFTLPKVAGGVAWRRLLDTTEPALADDRQVYEAEKPFDVPGRSLILFVCQPA
jgi:isoamylase